MESGAKYLRGGIVAKYDIEVIRHSSAHLMVQAIQRLFPEEKISLGIGPSIENGFYYDIKMDRKILDEELPKIEKKMKEIIKEKIPIEKKVFSNKDEAINFFKEKGQDLKIELIEELPENEEICTYTQGEFVDLCRGPHVKNTRELPMYFKLMNTAGAYWRGDSSRPMLQRIYALCFSSKEELKKHLNFLEEAKKRDHRKLGKDLDLFLFTQDAPAMPFFLPKGAFVYRELADLMRRILNHFDYQEVITPQMMDVELWKTSGHYQNYSENMYFSEVDNREYALKPMNCPAHMIIFKTRVVSYRELPMRIADFGRIHRYEKSGTLAGLTRVRTFCQDDAHIFLRPDQVKDEIFQILEIIDIAYKHLGFEEVSLNFATRPEKKVGDDATWDKAEAALKEALDQSGQNYEIEEGDGAFYGPKIDIKVKDAIGRQHQLATIQLDFQLPERFDLNFTNADGKEERPMVIHRAVLGSLERFFGLFLEHVAGAFPFWIAPEQAVLVPVKNEYHAGYCKDIATQLKRLGMRVRVDDRNESMGRKTREAQTSKIPFMLVAGDREVEHNSLSVRKYGEKQSETMSVHQVIELFQTLQKERTPRRLRFEPDYE